MEVINNFWAAIGKFLEWGSTEEPFIVGMTMVGTLVSMLALYMMLAYIVPAVVSVIIQKIRRTKFVRKIDRVLYLLRKEYGKKPTSHRDGEPRVISTLTGNLNGSR